MTCRHLHFAGSVDGVVSPHLTSPAAHVPNPSRRPAGCRRDPIPGIQPARRPHSRRLEACARPRSAAAVSSPPAGQCRREDLPGIRPRQWRGPPSFLPPSVCRCRVLAVSVTVGSPGLARPGRARARQFTCTATRLHLGHPAGRLALASRGARSMHCRTCARLQPHVRRSARTVYSILQCSMMLVRVIYCMYVYIHIRTALDRRSCSQSREEEYY